MSRIPALHRPGRFAAIAFAAAATVAAIGILPHGTADARRPNPGHNRGEIERLRAENAQLRSDLTAYQGAYTELSSGLDRVDRINSRNRDRRMQRDVQRAITRARNAAAQFVGPGSDFPGTQPGYGPDAPPPPPPPDVQPAMPQAELDGLVARVRKASFGDDQLALIREAARYNLFSVDQVVALVKAVSFEDTGIEIAVMLYPRVVDPQRWYTVYDAFSFSSSKQAVRERTTR